MFYRSLFPRDVFAELDRFQRDMHSAFDSSPSIRGLGRGGFPALNVGSTPTAIEVYAFAPGLDPASIEVHVDRGVLTIAGSRASALPARGVEAGEAAPGARTAEPAPTVHVNERFAGRFRQVLSLPDDIDNAAVAADYKDGVLHVSVPRRAQAQPRRISVQ